MKKDSCLLAMFVSLLFTACNTATPENYFDSAVLNSNMLVGFADDMQLREFESPSATMGKNGETISMTRQATVDSKIKFLEEALAKIRGLKETAPTKDMLQKSIELHEYVIPVYKTEYTQLAKAFDENASKETITTMAQVIHNKYSAHYTQLYNQLISIGKVYAKKNSIPVNWN